MLGEKIRQTPSCIRHDAELAALGELGAIRQDKLYMARQFLSGNDAAIGSERVVGSGDHDERNVGRVLLDQTGRKCRQGTHDAKARSPIHNWLHGAAQRLDIKAQRRGRELHTKLPGSFGDYRDREKHVNYSSQLSLESAGYVLGSGFHGIDTRDYRACVRQEDAAFLRQYGPTHLGSQV
jgi:hypothetical protein